MVRASENGARRLAPRAPPFRAGVVLPPQKRPKPLPILRDNSPFKVNAENVAALAPKPPWTVHSDSRIIFAANPLKTLFRAHYPTENRPNHSALWSQMKPQRAISTRITGNGCSP